MFLGLIEIITCVLPPNLTSRFCRRVMSSSSSASSDERSSSPHPELPLNEHIDNNSSSSEGEASSNDHATPEEPVLSHADKRRQKKKKDQQPVGPDGTHINHSNGAKETNTPRKRQNSVWVGNLSFKTTPDSLRNFFDGVGEITRVHMPTKLSAPAPGVKGQIAFKENRGSDFRRPPNLCLSLTSTIPFYFFTYTCRFAYVDFATPDSKLVAISLSENPLDGRRLLIKDGQSTCSRRAPDLEL